MHTQEWRRQQLGRHDLYAVDAVGLHEATARMLDQRIRKAGDRVLLVGASSLTLALLAELAHREREAVPVNDAGTPVFERVDVLGPYADGVVSDHEVLQSRFGQQAGNRVHPGVLAADVDEVTAWIDRALADGHQPVVVFTDEPDASRPDPQPGRAQPVRLSVCSWGQATGSRTTLWPSRSSWATSRRVWASSLRRASQSAPSSR